MGMVEPLLSVLGLVGTAVFGIMSVVLGLRALRPRSIAWGWVTETVSTDVAHGDLGITYLGRQLDAVHITKAAFWNSGAAAIGGEEISKTDPLLIGFDDGAEILSVQVLAETSKGVGLTTERIIEGTPSIKLVFDTLNRAEGFALRILHCGPSSLLQLGGTIRDVNNVYEIDIADRANISATPRRVIIGAAICVFAFFFVIVRSAVVTFFLSSSSIVNSVIFGTFVTIYFLLALVALITMARSSEKQMPAALAEALSRDNPLRHYRVLR